jgi:hypothetical protein
MERGGGAAEAAAGAAERRGRNDRGLNISQNSADAAGKEVLISTGPVFETGGVLRGATGHSAKGAPQRWGADATVMKNTVILPFRYLMRTKCFYRLADPNSDFQLRRIQYSPGKEIIDNRLETEGRRACGRLWLFL